MYILHRNPLENTQTLMPIATMQQSRQRGVEGEEGGVEGEEGGAENQRESLQQLVHFPHTGGKEGGSNSQNSNQNHLRATHNGWAAHLLFQWKLLHILKSSHSQ